MLTGRAGASVDGRRMIGGNPLKDRGSRSRRLLDMLSELTGAYRLRALAGGSFVALGAVLKSPSHVRIGRGVHVQRGSLLHGGGREWSGHAGHIHLAEGVRIGPNCVIYGAGGVELGRFTHLGPGAQLLSQSGRHSESRESDHPDYTFDSIRIGDGTWIGAGAVILGGTTIGRCVSIGPNAVVSGQIANFAVVMGNPGRGMFFNSGKPHV